MNKKFSHAVSAFFIVCLLAHSVSSYAQDPPPKVEIQITSVETSEDQNEERGFSIAAYYSSQTSAVEVIATGAGISIIFIKDSSGNIVAQTTMYSADEIGFLAVPGGSGIYQIEIESSRYYSCGYFIKK